MIRQLSTLRSAWVARLAPPRQLSNLAIGVVKETEAGEARVSLAPVHVQKLVKAGATVAIQSEAGQASGYSDDAYAAAGARIVDEGEAWKAQLVTKVTPPTLDEASRIEGRSLLSMIQPLVNTDLVDKLATQGATVFSLDSLLRTLSRGQAFDVLSSQANVAGYRSVVEASHHLQRPFSGQMTAAGKIAPAQVLVVGAGVAGLAAIQLSKKLGAMVYGFDVRSAAKEQVESCGAKFLEVNFKVSCCFCVSF